MNTQDTAPPRAPRGLRRVAPAVARYLLGLPLLVFGLNGFLNFIPQPDTPIPDRAAAFAGALVASGYMMPMIAITFLIVGACLTLNRFVPLALALFAPFIVNSIAFHLFLERGGLPIASIFLALELYLAWAYRRSYAPLFAARSDPA